VSDSEDDDLHGRQLVLLLLFFGMVSGGLYLIGWLTRPGFLYDHPLVCAAIAGGACYPARFLVERFDWWKRLGQPRRRLPAAEHRAANRRSWGEKVLRVARIVVGVPIALGSLAILPLGIMAGKSNEELIAKGPIQQATVVSVEEDRWSKYDDLIVKVARPGDGKVVELDGGNELAPVPAVGDRIDVVVDPEDPSYVIAAAVGWSTPWWAYPLGVIITLLCCGLGLAIAFG
jgi:hypothetical protein